MFVWHGVALHGVSIRVYQYFGGVLAAFLACACIISMWRFSMASLGSSSGQRLLCIFMHAPAHVLVVLLGSAFGVLALVCFLLFPLPTQGSGRGLSFRVFFFH